MAGRVAAFKRWMHQAWNPTEDRNPPDGSAEAPGPATNPEPCTAETSLDQAIALLERTLTELEGRPETPADPCTRRQCPWLA